MSLSGVLLRQKVLSLKGPPTAEADHVYPSFCCYFYLVFINLLLFFSSIKNLQVELMQADTFFYCKRGVKHPWGLQNSVEGLLCFLCHLAF